MGCVRNLDVKGFSKQRQVATILSYAVNGDIYTRILTKDTVWHCLPFGLAMGKVIHDTLPSESVSLREGEETWEHYRITERLRADTTSIAGKVVTCVRLRVIE